MRSNLGQKCQSGEDCADNEICVDGNYCISKIEAERCEKDCKFYKRFTKKNLILIIIKFIIICKIYY